MNWNLKNNKKNNKIYLNKAVLKINGNIKLTLDFSSSIFKDRTNRKMNYCAKIRCETRLINEYYVFCFFPFLLILFLIGIKFFFSKLCLIRRKYK